MCAKNIENLQGRVLLQSSAFHAYDTDKVVAHARSYAREFEKAGISKDRICIKIPATGPALNASPILLKEGIRTLGTSLFSVAQAIAASQAQCLSISPYINRESFPLSSNPRQNPVYLHRSLSLERFLSYERKDVAGDDLSDQPS